MSARKNARYRRLLQGARTRIRDLITESWYRMAASSANAEFSGPPAPLVEGADLP